MNKLPNWVLAAVVTGVIPANRWHDTCVVQASIYLNTNANEGPSPKGGKQVRYGAVYELVGERTNVCHSDISKAIREAPEAPRGLANARLGSAKTLYTDWGDPIRMPCADGTWRPGEGSLVWF